MIISCQSQLSKLVIEEGKTLMDSAKGGDTGVYCPIHEVRGPFYVPSITIAFTNSHQDICHIFMVLT
eukprot:scaffold1233_cov164-Chaetoceros_neogracile.AAC.2